MSNTNFSDKSYKEYKNTLRAATYKELCLRADEFSRESNGTFYGKRTRFKPKRYSIGEYGCIDSKHEPDSNFKATTFKKGNEIVVCFVGTDPKSPKDQTANAKMAFFGLETKQFKSAKKYLQDTKDKNPNCKIVLASHSEGAGESVYARGLDKDIEIFSYNGYTVSKLLKDKDGKIHKEDIHNFRTPNDIVSKNFTLSKDYGQYNIVQTKETNKPFYKANFLHEHSLENMDFDQKLIDMEYKLKQDPNFYSKCKEHGIDKIRQNHHEVIMATKEHPTENENITSALNREIFNNFKFENGISDLIFSNELYNILSPNDFRTAQPVLNFLQNAGSILPQTEIDSRLLSGNLVEVSAYTRADGTKVSAYVRSAPSK